MAWRYIRLFLVEIKLHVFAEHCVRAHLKSHLCSRKQITQTIFTTDLICSLLRSSFLSATSKIKWHCFSCAVINVLITPFPRWHLKVVIKVLTLRTSSLRSKCGNHTMSVPSSFVYFLKKKTCDSSLFAQRDLIGCHCEDVWCGYVSHAAWKPQNNVWGQAEKTFFFFNTTYCA